MFVERTPAAADVKHAIAGFHTDLFDGKLDLAGHGIFERLVVVEEHAL